MHVVWSNVEPSNSAAVAKKRLRDSSFIAAEATCQLTSILASITLNMGQGSSTLDALASITQRLLTEKLLPDDSIWSNIFQVFGFTCSMETFPATSPPPFSLARLDFSVRSCNYSFPHVNIFEK